MSMFKYCKPGSWGFMSNSDPRWNITGRSEEVGMFQMPIEAKDELEQLKTKYGEPPDDLTWFYLKD